MNLFDAVGPVGNQDINVIKYKERWVPYSTIFNKDLLREQIRHLTKTNLQNGSHDSITFLYDTDIATFNDYICDNIHKIKTEDYEKEFCGEIYYTNKIEGANTTIAKTIAIHNGAPIDKSNNSERMIKNCFDATKFLNLRQRIDKDILQQLWNIIVDGVCENEDIRGDFYRNGDIIVGGHEGVPYNDISDLMDKWLDFHNGTLLEDYPFIKAIILHYMFETIHPFCDGNGRTGRILMNNYLITHGYEEIKAISFSHTIDMKRSAYDAAFVSSETTPNNDVTPFIRYMLYDVMAFTIETILSAN